ncbi:TolC family protein [Autumnicola edwardsiae]|uniref:TolC family protein n=1 Tax=Autumnicola edwardsiae TaxID=3075594 RepID=A0ABU3CY65_9FLAO|nr:TolC family protein [Zunongwangia sp. F297]MDT0651206.1 TolC family protein [Zunongwangia sp. F297]
MTRNKSYHLAVMVLALFFLYSCNVSKSTVRSVDTTVPASYNYLPDSAGIALLDWKEYFNDPKLAILIDQALDNNKELNITLQDVEIDSYEITAKKGEYLPFLGLRGAAGIEKDGEYTRHGAVDKALHIKDGQAIPEPLPDYMVGAYASWEIDIWNKLRNSKKAAVSKYLASVEGKNFLITQIIAEVANSYYELMALDNILEIINNYTEIQEDALRIVKQQKEAARVTQLAVNRFEAQLLNTQNLQYQVQQQITETENNLNFLTGRFSQEIQRNSGILMTMDMERLATGIPSELLKNRPDIRQAEMQLEAAKLDVKVARADFYPSFRIEAEAGFEAFDAAYLINPESVLYNLAGEVMAPLLNRNAIKAAYKTANAKQLQAVFNYEQTILSAYLEVKNQLSAFDNYAQSFEKKSQEVERLNRSIEISNSLFRSARADYLEVLLTQREALESRLELIEIKQNQLNAQVNAYKALGGGWEQQNL